MLDLEALWYLVVVILMIGYSILDGFDLGVGILHFFVRGEHHRRIMINTIGPVWDGNGVWLVTFCGALFAGFPIIYATLFSTFYIPLMAVLFCIMCRAIAIEFRSKQESRVWRFFWDMVFGLSSLGMAWWLGWMVGEVVMGLPLNENFEPAYGGVAAVKWYSALVGVLAVSLFMVHGCLYALMKTEGELHDRLKHWVKPTLVFFIFMYIVVTIATLVYYPHMVESMKHKPYLFAIAFLAVIAIINILHQVHKNRDGWAFLSSSATILLLIAVYAIGMFPTILRSSIEPETRSLTAYNGGASEQTLAYLLIIVVIGMPLVVSYFAGVYRVFRGKVKIDHMSY